MFLYWAASARRFQYPDDYVPDGRTTQRNTHNTEQREVVYPWHPWYGRSVWIYQARTRAGRALFFCGLKQNWDVRALEIPQWMFEASECCRMQVQPTPAVSCEALCELKRLLSCVSRKGPEVVLEAQHRSLLITGDADANLKERATSNSERTVSSADQNSAMGGVAARGPAADRAAVSAVAQRTREKRSRVRSDQGGAR
jgi:hypothetical protein